MVHKLRAISTMEGRRSGDVHVLLYRYQTDLDRSNGYMKSLRNKNKELLEDVVALERFRGDILLQVGTRPQSRIRLGKGLLSRSSAMHWHALAGRRLIYCSLVWDIPWLTSTRLCACYAPSILPSELRLLTCARMVR